jgi:hypothetical protein
MGTFTDQVNKFNRKVDKRIRVTAQNSVQETVRLAQRVRKKGGRMRVLTGFLRASIQASLNGMPSGPSDNPNGDEYGLDTQVAGEPVPVTLLKWDPLKGETMSIGWTANYARPREYHDGFLRGAVELWDQTVAKEAMKAKQSVR